MSLASDNLAIAKSVHINQVKDLVDKSAAEGNTVLNLASDLTVEQKKYLTDNGYYISENEGMIIINCEPPQ